MSPSPKVDAVAIPKASVLSRTRMRSARRAASFSSVPGNAKQNSSPPIRRDIVRPQLGAHNVAHFLKHFVARVVPVTIVDLLELIDVEQTQRCLDMLDAGATESALQARPEEVPVGQPGQGVVVPARPAFPARPSRRNVLAIPTTCLTSPLAPARTASRGRKAIPSGRRHGGRGIQAA